MRFSTSIFLFLALSGSLLSCLKKVDYPNEPVIAYEGITLVNWENPGDSAGIAHISFTDGDGDLGLDPSDTFGIHAVDSMYHFNLFVDYYEKQNGEFVLNEPVFPNHVRFPVLSDNEGAPLEGDMDIGVFADPFSPFDTVKWEIYIVDRALNRSNVVVTDEVVVTKP